MFGLQPRLHRNDGLPPGELVRRAGRNRPIDRPPDHVLVDRERRAYLADAVLALPERLRTVVIGYFFQERPMLEIADELGVTESRVSQLRAEP